VLLLGAVTLGSQDSAVHAKAVGWSLLYVSLHIHSLMFLAWYHTCKLLCVHFAHAQVLGMLPLAA
jgi:hypothetical protein